VVLNNFAMSRALSGDLPEARRLIAEAAAGAKDDRIVRNVKLINGLTLKVAQTQRAPQSRVAGAPAPIQSRPLAPAKVTTGAPRALTTPRPITAQEGKAIVMQAVPYDPKAGPVGKKKPRAVAANAPTAPVKKQPADNSGIPALRLANDRQ
jgi:hypothetical protein